MSKLIEKTSNLVTTLETNSSEEVLKLKIVFKKNTHELCLSSDKTVSQLKQEIHSFTSVAPDLQKLILKGKTISGNDYTLAKVGLKSNDKILLVGSTLFDVSSALTPSSTSAQQIQSSQEISETPFCKQSNHKKIIDKGVPGDATMAYKNGDEPLPAEGVRGMIDKYMKKCRFRFKLETDELWICSGDKTTKYSISNIDAIEDQPIEGREEYHILLIRMSSGTALWFYWVPHQYIKAIKNTIF